MVTIRSTWTAKPINIDGNLDLSQWSNAGKLPLGSAGSLLVKNDAQFLYLAFDLVGDLGNDASPGDYFWFFVDVDGNRAITPNRDLLYGVFPGQPNRIAKCYLLRPGATTGIVNEPTDSKQVMSFGPSLNAPNTSHRIWELRLSLSEIGVDFAAADTPPVVRCGVRVASTTPAFVQESPANPSSDFSNLHQIVLARQPDSIYPPGTAGAVIGGVGLIPASVIGADGRSNTDASYFILTVDAAFGGTMNIIGNRVMMQNLVGQGAVRYRINYRVGSAPFRPLRQSWTNYRWNGITYILESYGPDSNDTYPMLNPSQDYSIDDLLLQWRSGVGFESGLYQLQAEFLRSDGSVVPAPAQTLTLLVDNNQPRVQLEEIRHNDNLIGPCGIVNLSPTSTLQFRFTAFDPEGNLASYSLEAFYGSGERVELITPVTYTSNPSRSWQGVQGLTVAALASFPPVTCAYQIRVSATPRVTNGYGYPNGVSNSRYITLIKPASAVAPSAVMERITDKLPFGV